MIEIDMHPDSLPSETIARQISATMTELIKVAQEEESMDFLCYLLQMGKFEADQLAAQRATVQTEDDHDSDTST